MRELDFELHHSLVPLERSDWQRFFSNHPDPPELIELMQRSGLEGVELKSIVGRAHGKIAIVLPVFIANYSIASTLDEPIKGIVSRLEKIFSSLLYPRVFGIGFIEGEWGQIGYSPDLPSQQLENDLNSALTFVGRTARNVGAQLIAFKDFCPSLSHDSLPAAARKSFARATSLPFCQLDLPYADLDDYLNHLPRKVRHDLKRKQRQSVQVEVRRETDVGQHLDDIYSMYLELVSRTALSFGVHNKRYFSEICASVPGAFYFLFFLEGKLIGFNLVIEQESLMIDKYIGMKPDVGRENNIYFLALMEKIKYCTERRIKLIHLGAAAEDVKTRLGARAIESDIWFHHLNPLGNLVLSRLAPMLSYEPAIQG